MKLQYTIGQVLTLVAIAISTVILLLATSAVLTSESIQKAILIPTWEAWAIGAVQTFRYGWLKK